MIDPYTDPDELFDVCDATGRPTGRTKRRADVHRDGDWHRSFHCWVTSEAGAVPMLLLQRRGARKDTWPDRLDVTVGGHFAAGETLDGVVREVEEEIGRTVALGDLISLGRRVAAGELQPGVLDREVQEVFLWRSQLPLEAYRPQPVEVGALVEAPLPDLLRLFAGQVSRVQSREMAPGQPPAPGSVRAEDFVPVADAYFFRAAIAIDHALHGYPYPAV